MTHYPQYLACYSEKNHRLHEWIEVMNEKVNVIEMAWYGEHMRVKLLTRKQRPLTVKFCGEKIKPQTKLTQQIKPQ